MGQSIREGGGWKGAEQNIYLNKSNKKKIILYLKLDISYNCMSVYLYIYMYILHIVHIV